MGPYWVYINNINLGGRHQKPAMGPHGSLELKIGTVTKFDNGEYENKQFQPTHPPTNVKMVQSNRKLEG